MKFDAYQFFHDDIWLILGCIFIVLKFYFRTYTKLTIISACAFLNQILIELKRIDDENYLVQIVVFVSTSVIGIIFLDPILKRKYQENVHSADNPIGDIAVVDHRPLDKSSVGVITWHGFEKKAALDSTSAIDSLEVGSEVIVTHIDGDVFTVRPKEESTSNEES